MPETEIPESKPIFPFALRKIYSRVTLFPRKSGFIGFWIQMIRLASEWVKAALFFTFSAICILQEKTEFRGSKHKENQWKAYEKDCTETEKERKHQIIDSAFHDESDFSAYSQRAIETSVIFTLFSMKSNAVGH